MGLLLPLFLVSLDIISTSLALYLAYLVDGNGMIAINQISTMLNQVPILIVLIIFFASIFRLYRRMLRYAGTSELLAVLGSVLSSVACLYLYSRYFNYTVHFRLYVITIFFLLIFIGGSRLGLRGYNYIMSKTNLFNKAKQASETGINKRVLIVGAGDAGAVIARELVRYHSGGSNLVGFIDDDKNKQKLQMFGVSVLGDRYSIKENVVRYNVDEIIVAMPSIDKHNLRQIVEICQRTKCSLKILPGIYEIINGEVSISRLRNVEIEDLLGRDPVELDNTAVRAYIADKIVLVTGGGGSIGSEICRQVAKMMPKKLLILGKGENSIYEIHQELLSTYPGLKIVPIIASVRDRKRIEEIMSKYHPQVVFHAAAHKHVPLMEYQPIEAVKNNVWGTKVVAETADKFKVETFVMISTDKAVNPTSVMGCTKRVAEMFVQSMNAISSTRFVVVRFGNVLGSRGSVIPLFKKQIAKGGPVTVTHPEMKRYFMTIPEASQLVLQAGAMAKGGEVFVLDMGEPVKICDLAKELIKLSGFVPDVDIKIQYTGLRPGEKLFEELLSAEDGTDATEHKKLFTARIKEVSKKQMDVYVEELLADSDDEVVVQTLQKVVPTYKPNRIND